LLDSCAGFLVDAPLSDGVYFNANQKKLVLLIATGRKLAVYAILNGH